MKEKIKVTIIATGFKDKQFEKRQKTEKDSTDEKKEEPELKTGEVKKVAEKEKIFPELKGPTKNIRFNEDDDLLDIPTFLRKDKNNY
jgi:hypothetical protein